MVSPYDVLLMAFGAHNTPKSNPKSPKSTEDETTQANSANHTNDSNAPIDC